MNIGEQINRLRKEGSLSQDDFANLFHVSRQTVSNWENGKSYPDLEMLMKISDHFKVSVDELLRGDTCVVQKIDSEKKKKNYYQIFIVILIFIAGVIIFGLYFKFQSENSVSFTMKKKETYQGTNTAQDLIDVGKGYFSLPKSGNLNINAEASTDDGNLHIKIIDDKDKIYYQLDGQAINDSQTLYFEKGSYIIQIVADDYTEDVVSMEYYIKVSN